MDIVGGDVTILGFSTLALIGILVNLYRSTGFSAKLIPVVAIAGGFLLISGNLLYGDTAWFFALTNGLVLGATSVGVYEMNKK